MLIFKSRQELVVSVLVFALPIWPQLSARQAVMWVAKTLTMNNGGSSAKNANDRQGRVLAEVLTKLGEQTMKLDEHLLWPEGYVKDAGDRLAVLEQQKKRP